jgi:hypothetical protein
MRSTPTSPVPVRELLTIGQQASRTGLHLAAGVITRIGLETHLRDLCELYACEPHGGKRGIGCVSYADALFKRRYIARDDRKEIIVLSKTGNRCAHNAGVDWFEVEQLIAGVRGIVDRYAVDHEKLENWRRLREFFERHEDEGDERKGGAA